MCATKQSDVGTLQDQLESDVAQLGTERDSWRGEQQLLKQERQQLTDQLMDAKQHLAAALNGAKQQQQRDQTYQDELVTDKQEALQVWPCAYAHLQADIYKQWSVITAHLILAWQLLGCKLEKRLLHGNDVLL